MLPAYLCDFYLGYHKLRALSLSRYFGFHQSAHETGNSCFTLLMFYSIALGKHTLFSLTLKASDKTLHLFTPEE